MPYDFPRKLICNEEVKSIGRYENIRELPKLIRVALPDPAQALYLEAYNKTWDQSENLKLDDTTRDAAAHRAGWEAVEAEYVHDPAQGRWYHKDELNNEAGAGILDKLKGLIE